MIIDFHAHLCDLNKDFDGLILNTGYSDACNHAIPKRGVFALGIAPQYAESFKPEWLAYIESQKPPAIGEIGLDGKYWHPRQMELLRLQLDIAEKLSVPIVVHSRMAEEKLFGVLLKRHWRLPVIFHFYSGPEDLAERIITELDGYISFPPRFSARRRRLAARLPLTRMVIESDCPYVGEDPTATEKVKAEIAQLRGIDPTDVEQTLVSTWQRLFGKGVLK